MSDLRKLYRSFAGGQISRELFSRADLDKHQTGAQLLRNFIATPYGPAQARPGSKYVIEAKDSTNPVRLFEFEFAVDQVVELEFGHQYIRFHTNGGTVTEADVTFTDITLASPAVFTSTAHPFADGDWLFLSNIADDYDLEGRAFIVANSAANTFELTELDGTAYNNTYAVFSGSATANRVYTLTSPFSGADLFEITYTQNNDIVTLAHPDYTTQELSRLAAASWTLTDLDTSPVLDPPTNPTVAVGAGTGSVMYRYKVTAVVGTVENESVASIEASLNTFTITNATQADPVVITTSGAHGLAVGEIVSIVDVVGMTELNNKNYKVGAVPLTTTIELQSLDAVDVDGTGFTAYSSGGTLGESGVTNNLGTSTNNNVVTWDAVAGADRYNVYKDQGKGFGFIGQTEENSLTDRNILPDELRTPPQFFDYFNGADNQPGAVTYFDQRRVFAATNNEPQSLFMTRAGDGNNLSGSIPTRDNDAIVIEVASQQQNRIRHMIALGDLILLTAAGEWRVYTSSGEPIVPATIQARAQSYVGASIVRPSVTSASVLYVASKGSHFRELFYSDDNSTRGYRTEDLSILTPDMVDNYTIKDMSYSRGPIPILWAVRSDGQMLALTYLPEQKVRAWSQHDTLGGTYESVICVSEGNEDVRYTVVNRTINGRQVRYIERFESLLPQVLEDSFYVDCGLTYDGAAVEEVSGLHHLEGETVSILADGAVHPQQVVTNGTVSLEVAASKVHVGLPITSDLQTMPFFDEALSAFGEGVFMNVIAAYLRVTRASGVFVGANSADLVEHKQRTDEDYGEPPRLISEVIEVPLHTEWQEEGSVFVRKTAPLPLTVQSIALEVSVGG